MTQALPLWPDSMRLPVTERELTDCSEWELARKAAGGDMEAFAEVYRRHQRRVYTLCLRMTQNVSEAEDLTQEVFIHLFHAIGSFRGESAFTTWLHRLTTNQVLMHFRRARARRDATTGDGALPERTISGREATRHLPVLDQLGLDHALAQLPPGYRMVFILHDIEGYEHEEIGRMLGCAAGTSKSQLHKARMRLRKLLNKSVSLTARR